MDFLETPYLPQKKISTAVANLSRPDMRIITPFYDTALPESLRLHADLTFCYLGHRTAVCAPEAYNYYAAAFSHIPLRLLKGATSLDMHYPRDTSYNIAIVGKTVFCKKDSADRVLLDQCEKMGYTVVNINQGYGKCSVCPVDATSAISADPSFLKAAEKHGIEVLPVSDRHIHLAGYSNGFFGGCAYMEDLKTLTVNGNLSLCDDFQKISDFAEKRGITLKYSAGQIEDFGSLIPVTEE